MATHFVCHSTEPLPHRYSAGGSDTSHGAVSQYELYNMTKKAHVHFSPPGWDFSLTSEEDSLPLIQPVAKQSSLTAFINPDPDLCITPERPKLSSCSPGMVPEINPDPLLCVTPDKSQTPQLENVDKKGKQRVRFEVAEQFESDLNATDFSLQGSTRILEKRTNRTYQPGQYGSDCGGVSCDSKDSQKLSSKTVQYTVGKEPSKSVHFELEDPSEPASMTESTSYNDSVSVSLKQTSSSQRNTQAVAVRVLREKDLDIGCTDPIAACRSHGDSVPQKRKVKVLRENQYVPQASDYTYPYKPVTLEANAGEEHMFARPEYNSTLRMKKDVEQLKDSSIDVVKAVQRSLNISETARNQINEKAANMVNTETTYKGLVSLEIPVEELVNQASEMKYTLPNVVKCAKPRKYDKEPDLMEFLNSDMVQESVSYNLIGVSTPSQQLSAASHWGAFDLYRHNRLWENHISK